MEQWSSDDLVENILETYLRGEWDIETLLYYEERFLRILSKKISDNLRNLVRNVVRDIQYLLEVKRDEPTLWFLYMAPVYTLALARA